ncbi:hypothetical protein QF036_002178 [Arthrobacter globiformis]|nr:hypothetical protein [Arthrobacter globiformis]
MDLDSTLVASPSDKEHVAGTSKVGFRFGHRPLVLSCSSGTVEILAGIAPGKPARTAAWTISVSSDTAADQLREAVYDKSGAMSEKKVLVHGDSAGVPEVSLASALHGRAVLHHFMLPLGKASMIRWINDSETDCP